MSGGTPTAPTDISGKASVVLTNKGDVATFDTARTRLAVGSNDQVLTADSTVAKGLAWKTNPDITPPTTTKGDLSGYSTSQTRIGIGSNDQVLTADSTTALGLAWKTASGIPSGVILMWSGLIANIPSGWVICDGNNSTPNLLTKFIRSVATVSTEAGSTGGSDSVTLTTAQLASHTHTQNAHTHTQNAHTHTQNAHGHGGSTNTTGDHTHTTDNTPSQVRSGGGAYWASGSSTSTTSSSGSHSHTVTVTDSTAVNQNTTAVNQNATAVNQNAGSGSSHENRPAYFELIYIMKS
jgi:hypothetical protein